MIILFIISLSFYHFHCSETVKLSQHKIADNSVCHVKYEEPIKRIFSRKRRFIVFPNYCAMKITVATGKKVIVKYPRGINLSLEVSVYYPLPTILDEWYPKAFRSPTTPKPTIPRRKNPPIFPRIDDNVQPQDLIDPLINFNNSFNQNKWKLKNPWENSKNNFDFDRQNFTKWNPKFSSSFSNSKWSIKSNGFKNGNLFKSPTKYSHQYDYPHKIWKNNKKWFNYDGHTKENQHDIYNQKPKYYPELEAHKNWKHIRGHRDRKDIYGHLESLSSILLMDMKSCILRSICDAKRYLLPKGYSLIHDILRIVFSLPTLDGINDDYSKAMQDKNGECEQNFENLCPLSLLDLLMNPDHTMHKI